jgi:hypothetical protein
MNRLEEWDDAGIISILMPETAHGEARQGGDLKRRFKTSLAEINLAQVQRPEPAWWAGQDL